MELSKFSFEYEMIWAFGANLGISDLDLIAKIDHLMDDLGVDAIETGITLALATETDLIEYGDGERAYEILKYEVARNPARQISREWSWKSW